MTDYRRHVGPEKLEATLILWCNYDLWQGQIGQKLIQEIMNEEKAARKAAADQARTILYLCLLVFGYYIDS